MTFPLGNYQAIVPRQNTPLKRYNDDRASWMWLFYAGLSMIIYILLFSQCDLTPAIRVMSAILNAANSSFKVRKTTEDRIQTI